MWGAEAVAKVERAVVDAGEDVAMKVDHRRNGANSVSGTCRRRRRTTMSGMIQHLLSPGL